MNKNIWVNEDNSFFYELIYRNDRDVTVKDINKFVDKYMDSGVSTVLFTPNSMCTSYRSKVWDYIWHGYNGSNSVSHPLFKSIKDDMTRMNIFRWVHVAWQLDRDGIDPYRLWMKRSRQCGISPWVSMRMNDVHFADDKNNILHSKFWKNNPQLRNVILPDALDADGKNRIAISKTDRHDLWTESAFNYYKKEVQDHHFKLIEELVEKYDFDGFELDWMRFGVMFPPSDAWKGQEVLTKFVKRVRKLLDKWEIMRKHPIRLGARVPVRPDSALSLGMDAPTWAKEEMIDHLVVTPFFESIDNDIPIELWRKLLCNTQVELAAGLEMLVRPSPKSNKQYNTTETVRGSAISALSRGADHVYLFNYFKNASEVIISIKPDFLSENDFNEVMNDTTSIKAMQGKPRRHILTFTDRYGPGQPTSYPLPKKLKKNEFGSFRIHIGPLPKQNQKANLIIGLDGYGKDILAMTNNHCCIPNGKVEIRYPIPEGTVYAFDIPKGSLEEGYNIIELYPEGDCIILWVELDIK